MDPKQFFNDSIRKRFTRDSIGDMSPQLAYVCHVMEKHVKTDDRKAGRYNLIHLIENRPEEQHSSQIWMVQRIHSR